MQIRWKRKNGSMGMLTFGRKQSFALTEQDLIGLAEFHAGLAYFVNPNCMDEQLLPQISETAQHILSGFSFLSNSQLFIAGATIGWAFAREYRRLQEAKRATNAR